MYFDLVRLYGKPYNMDKTSYGVPLVLEPLDVSAQPTRASVEAVYTQIMKDLTDAAPLLSKNKVKGFINYYANMAHPGKSKPFHGQLCSSACSCRRNHSQRQVHPLCQ